MSASNAAGWRPEMGPAQHPAHEDAAQLTNSGDRALMLEEPTSRPTIVFDPIPNMCPPFPKIPECEILATRLSGLACSFPGDFTPESLAWSICLMSYIRYDWA